MLSPPLQRKYLDKILASKEFEGSKIYRAYLSYLVEACSSGKDVKETTIAMDVFGKDSSFNPAEDTIVRSHTYNLRKKLETYYLTEGKDDRYRLKIPKGHYEVTFVPVSQDGSVASRLAAITSNGFYILAIVALTILSAYLWLQQRTIERELQRYQTIAKDDPIWQEYLQSELPVLVAPGDHFFFSDFSDEYGEVLGIRHGKVNSMEDLETFKRLFPDRELRPADEPYFPYHSIWSLPPILSILYSSHITPIMRKSSSISPQMLDEYNIIFVGSIKTLYILRHTLSKSNFRFEISPHKIIYSPPDSVDGQYFETSLHSPGPNDDLVLAVKLPGPAGNAIFIIASFHSLGAPEVASYLTQPATRKYLETLFMKKFDKVPKYFELLFRVTGIDKTAYNTEILICNEISER